MNKYTRLIWTLERMKARLKKIKQMYILYKKWCEIYDDLYFKKISKNK